jgi:RimJ/RimL family protein N-acetyltransferase
MKNKVLLDLSTLLESTRLLIRQYREGNGKEFYHFLEDGNNRNFLKEHVSEALTISSDDEAEIRVRELIADWVARKRFVMGIWNKSNKQYLGQIWIEPNKWAVPSFELGWFLGQSHQKQGYATEAAHRSLQFLFDELKANKVIVLVRHDNEQSINLAKRCGFVKEGHLRNHNVINGKIIDLLYFGLLKEEYEKTV